MSERLVLASASPRRREILEKAGISFTVRPADVDETPFLSLSPRLAVQLLAARKAAAAAENADEWIVGADTIVVCDNVILGKPSDRAEAFEMLRMLSGRTHSVLTGIAVIRTRDGYMRTHCEETQVTFRPLSDKEIYTYMDTGEPMDKAGAYGIQGKGGAFVEKTEGDFQNVVGLPPAALLRLLHAMQKER